MKYPNFTDPQFLDANGTGGLNFAMTTLQSSIASMGSGGWAIPGVIAPEAMTVSFSGMTANVGLPSPWSLISTSGSLVRAHGTLTGSDTSSYSVNFAPLVPNTGSVVAILTATIASLQQDPFTITGPPAGHPNYNPNFVSTIGYATNVLSVSLAAVTGGIDNINTFELFRTTLVAGQSVLTAFSEAFSVRAGSRIAKPRLLIAGGLLTPAQAQYVIEPASAGQTFTLPAASGCGGLTFDFSNSSTGNAVVSAFGSDPIFGFGSASVSTLTALSGSSIGLYCDGTSWFVKNSSLNFGGPNTVYFGGHGTFNWLCPANVFWIWVDLWGAGGGSLGGTGASAGGGGYCGSWVAVVPGTNYTVVVGAGGVAPTNSSGLPGGTSSFSGPGIATLGATGGSGGGSGPGPGGVGTGGMINLTGQGGTDLTDSGSYSLGVVGNAIGGNAAGGGGFGGGVNSGNSSIFPTIPGGGGGANGANNAYCQNGADGGCKITWFRAP